MSLLHPKVKGQLVRIYDCIQCSHTHTYYLFRTLRYGPVSVADWAHTYMLRACDHCNERRKGHREGQDKRNNGSVQRQGSEKLVQCQIMINNTS